MKSALVLLALLSFLTKFSALGLPRVDYNQFAKSLDKKLPHGLFYVISIDIVADDYDIMQRYIFVYVDISYVMGCCPTITKDSSEISASGCEVRIKIVINITSSGKESTQVMQNCTAEDHKFM